MLRFTVKQMREVEGWAIIAAVGKCTRQRFGPRSECGALRRELLTRLTLTSLLQHEPPLLLPQLMRLKAQTTRRVIPLPTATVTM